MPGARVSRAVLNSVSHSSQMSNGPRPDAHVAPHRDHHQRNGVKSPRTPFLLPKPS